MITMNTRFGNIGNMKKGSNVLPKNAAWKPTSASDAAALEVIIPKVNRRTFDPERQVPSSGKLSLQRASQVSFMKVALEVTTTVGLVKMTNIPKAVSAVHLSLGHLPLMCT